MRRLHLTIVMVVALTLVTAACSSKSSTSSPTNTGTSAATTPASSGGGGASSATIVAQNFAFSPDSVDVKAGTVTLTVTNKDSAAHTFTLDDGSSDTKLAPGSTQTITLQVTATVGWHCSIHPSMTGTLNVA